MTNEKDFEDAIDGNEERQGMVENNHQDIIVEEEENSNDNMNTDDETNQGRNINIDETVNEIQETVGDEHSEKKTDKKFIFKVKKQKADKKQRKVKIWPIVKWGIGLIILIIGITFIGVNSNLCYNKYETQKISDKEKQVVYLSSNSVCEQKFKGYNGTLEQIGLYMDNQGRESSRGQIKIIIKNSSNREIGSTILNMKKIRTRKYAKFIFEKQPQLQANETYTMIIQCMDAYNAQKFGVYTTAVENEWYVPTAKIDGEKVENKSNLRSNLIFKYYDYKSMNAMIFIMVLALIIMLIPRDFLSKLLGKKLKKDIPVDKWISRIIFVAAPFVSYFMMESLSGFSIREILGFIILPKGVLNLVIYFVILLVAYAITNRTQYAAIILWIFTFVLGLTNYFVFEFRGVPVLASDVLSVGTALNVADSFEYTYDICVLWATSLITTFTALMLALTPYKGFKWIKRIPVAVVTVIAIVFANFFYISSDTIPQWNIEDSQWKPQLTYAENGSMLSFVTSWKYVKTEKPEGYSIDEVKKITSKFKSDDTSKTAAKKNKLPNVIAIMNESLADFSFDGKVNTSEDYLPFIRSMKENTIKGQLYVSIEGANTANSEFEFLTGNSLAFFNARAIPYNNYVNGVVPSLTRTLSSQGYIGNNSYHPYKRSGWNRANVYNSLGFENFFSEEYYQNPEFIRNFISDKTDMEQIIKDYQNARKSSKDPFYLFNVTVQNHGGYVGNRGFVKANIKVTDDNLKSKGVDQYLTLAKKSDEAFRELIEYFEKVDEPTVIVMFGDHQPPLSNTQFYQNIFGKDINELSPEQTSNWYSTPYVIWTNYNIKENDNMNMSANYLSSYLLKLMGADMTGYNKYLLNMQKKLPVLTGLFYQGDDGIFHDIDEESKYTDLINEYAKVQYNGLLDQKNRLKNFFFLKDGDYKVQEYDEDK